MFDVIHWDLNIVHSFIKFLPSDGVIRFLEIDEQNIEM